MCFSIERHEFTHPLLLFFSVWEKSSNREVCPLTHLPSPPHWDPSTFLCCSFRHSIQATIPFFGYCNILCVIFLTYLFQRSPFLFISDILSSHRIIHPPVFHWAPMITSPISVTFVLQGIFRNGLFDHATSGLSLLLRRIFSYMFCSFESCVVLVNLFYIFVVVLSNECNC